MYSWISFFYKKFYSFFTHFIAPPVCAYCSVFLSQRTVLCEDCFECVVPVVSHTIKLTPTKSLKVFALCAYKDPVKKLILAKGWSDIIASKELGQLIWEHTTIKHVPLDYIVPVPLHWTRYASRGFNQAHEIAKTLGAYSGKPVHHCITRKKRTVFQSLLSSDKRHENVKEVFAVNLKNKNIYKNKHLLLVDDLMTTGATLKESARALLKLKPASITAVVACRVV